MLVIAIAKRTAGLGCVKGDTHRNEKVQRIEDKEDHFLVVIHENWKIRYEKKNWQLIIVE